MPAELTIAFDADDTLWHNEDAFAEAEHRFNEIVSPWADAQTAQDTLIRHERDRLATHGYGVKSFVLAMIAAACDISNDEIGVDLIRSLVDISEELLTMPTVMIDGAFDAIAAVSADYPTMIITKGDLHHQLRRVDAANVAQFCFDVEVVADKDAATYRRVLERHRIDPDRFVMVGNSVVSDVAPVLELGARAVHVPYHVTWALETAVEDLLPSNHWVRLDDITLLLDHLDSLQGQG